MNKNKKENYLGDYLVPLIRAHRNRIHILFEQLLWPVLEHRQRAEETHFFVRFAAVTKPRRLSPANEYIEELVLLNDQELHTVAGDERGRVHRVRLE